MNALMKKLEKIQSECVEKKGLIQPADDKADEFTRIKKKIAADMLEVRQMIKDRDELEATASGTRHTVEASHNIRSKLKAIKADAQTLDTLQKKEKTKYEKKNKQNEEKEQQIENRGELVSLVFQHVKEVEALNNRKHGDSSFGSSAAGSGDPTITELPNIDDEGFQLLRRNDAIIDKHLEDIGQSVGVLKEMAVEMGKEAEAQGIMLDNLDKKVDDVNDQLENLNERMRKALESIRKGDRFIVDIILLCILLGIAGYIYSMFKK
jgi:t-SNARE complex subunit (syntaxin)